jgi:hypothetical protein
MPEARGSTPRGRTYDGIAQWPERLSHTQHVVCSTHTPVTDRKEVVVYWPTAVRVCALCGVLRDLSWCFDSDDDSFRLRGDAQSVPVANVATTIGE